MKASRGVRLERALEILKSRKDTSADAPAISAVDPAGDHAIVSLSGDHWTSPKPEAPVHA